MNKKNILFLIFTVVLSISIPAIGMEEPENDKQNNDENDARKIWAKQAFGSVNKESTAYNQTDSIPQDNFRSSSEPTFNSDLDQQDQENKNNQNANPDDAPAQLPQDNQSNKQGTGLFGYTFYNPSSKKQTQEHQNNSNIDSDNEQNIDGSQKYPPYKNYADKFPQQFNMAQLKGQLEGTAAHEAHRVMAEKTIIEAFKDGALGGIEKGTATFIATMLVTAAKLGIENGVQWWYQPRKEDLEKYQQVMELHQFIEDLEKSIEKKQKLLANNSAIVSTVGQNVEKAQTIFEKKLNQQIEELENEIKKYTSLQTKLLKQQKENEISRFQKKLTKEYEKKLKDFQQEQGILNDSSLSEDQFRTFNEFNKTYKQKITEEIEKYTQKQEKAYTKKLLTLQEQEEEIRQKALTELQQKNPETQFAHIYDQYATMALEALQEQRKMMDGTFAKEITAMLNKKSPKKVRTKAA